MYLLLLWWGTEKCVSFFPPTQRIKALSQASPSRIDRCCRVLYFISFGRGVGYFCFVKSSLFHFETDYRSVNCDFPPPLRTFIRLFTRVDVPNLTRDSMQNMKTEVAPKGMEAGITIHLTCLLSTCKILHDSTWTFPSFPPNSCILADSSVSNYSTLCILHLYFLV